MKKYVALLLSIIMVLSMAVNVSAAEGGITYEGGSGYSANKLSNPELGSGEIDGLVEINGENDRGQNYAWSSVGYGENVYVGTCFGAIYQTLRIMAMESGVDYSVMKKAIDVLYNGHLYNGDEGVAVTKNRSVLVKINTKTSEAKIVAGPTTAGGYRAAIEFQDKLYFAATGATPYILEVDPATDETQVVCYSEKPQSASISTGIRGLTVYKDQLVATMIGNKGAYMVASKNPSEGPDTFEVICTQEDLLDYPAYHYTDSIFGGSIWDIIEFNDKLYITVVTGKNGDKQAFALFSGQPDENGEWSYDLIAGNEEHGAEYPFGLGSDRSGAANLIVHDGYLYIGGYNDPMVALPAVLNMEFESLFKDLDSPVCLWRLDTDDNIEMVAGEANEVFPEGPVGNMGAGFGSNMNQYVWRMASYDGKLFLGTFDIGSLAYPLMQFTNGDILKMSKEEWQSQINYIKILIEAIQAEAAATPALMSLDEEVTEEVSPVETVSDLEEMVTIMDDMNELYDYSNSEVATFGLRDQREVFYNLLLSLAEKFDEVKEFLPEEVTEALANVLNEDVINNFKYFIETCAYLSKGERGFDLFVSNDGENFNTITRNGFGDPYNHGCRVFAITDTGLCVGTANPFYGAQVWQLVDNNRGPIEYSEVEAEGTYDKNPESEQHKAEVAIDFKGNTIDKIECNYEILEEGVDYVVTEEGIAFTDSFLALLDVADYNFTFFFNVGARGNYVLHVIDTTESSDDNGSTVDPEKPSDDEEDKKNDNKDENQKPSGVDTGDHSPVVLYAGIMVAMVAVCAVVLVRRKRA